MRPDTPQFFFTTIKGQADELIRLRLEILKSHVIVCTFYHLQTPWRVEHVALGARVINSRLYSYQGRHNTELEETGQSCILMMLRIKASRTCTWRHADVERLAVRSSLAVVVQTCRYNIVLRMR